MALIIICATVVQNLLNLAFSPRVWLVKKQGEIGDKKMGKRIICKMCGESIEQEGVPVCQNCHTKYSVEKIKKMVVETNVSTKPNIHDYIIL